MNRSLTIAAAVLTAMVSVQVLAQAPASQPATQPADPLMPKIEDPLEGLKEIDPAELDKTLKKATERRLVMERELALAEMENKMYPPTAMDEATRIMEAKPLNTQQDNIDRIVRAYAKLDKKFAEVYQLYTDKKYSDAAKKAESLVNEQSTYLNASAAYSRALSLENAGMIDDAGDAYSLILEKIYDRISFACESSIRMAKMFETNGRGMYAMQAYAYLLKNYSLSLDLKTIDEILKKLETMKDTYGDPLGTVAKLMGDVKERLHITDSGKTTQDKQKQIVAMLDDLIRMAQDQQNQGGGGGGDDKDKKEKDKKKEQGKGEGEGKGEGKGEGQGQKPGSQAGNPSKPATESVLRGGETSRAGRLSGEYKAGESGDWAALPPEKKAQLKEQMKRLTSERKEHMIRDYTRAVADER